MKLVFLDMERRHALLFQETGMTPIAFEKIYALKSMLKNEPVIYISDAVVTNAGEIVNLVNSLKDNEYVSDSYSNLEVDGNPQQNFNDPSNWANSEEPLFVHPTSNKRILIPDIGALDHHGQISGFTFQGYMDFQSLSYLSTIGFNNSHLIHALINNGTLEVVPKSQVDILKASYVPYSPAQNYNKKKYAQTYNQHNKHQSILVDNHNFDNQGTDLSSSGMDISKYAGGGFKGDDIIPIEVGGGINFKTGGSGAYGNEGQLIE